MAIYAPKTPDQTDHIQVASLVEANRGRPNAQAAQLTSLTVDGSLYRVHGPLAGGDGEIPYLGRRGAAAGGYSPETILRGDVYVCENRADCDRSLVMTMREVFDTWIKGGYSTLDNGKWYGYGEYPTNHKKLPLSGLAEWLDWNKAAGEAPSAWSDLGRTPLSSWRWPDDEAFGLPYGYPFWYYSPSVSSIIQPAGAYDDSFYASPYMMTSYDVTVRCRSYADRGGGVIGIVAAAVEAEDGEPRILTVNRSCDCSGTGSTQPYGHFYIKAGGARTGSAWTPVSAYCKEDLSCTFLADRRAFQTRFTDTVDVSAVSANQDYINVANTYGYGQLSAHSPGEYWPELSADGSFVESPAADFWKTRPLTYEYEHATELGLILSADNGMADPRNWWWLDDAKWDAHKSEVAYNGTWNNMGYCYIRVLRYGDILTVWTTKMTGSPLPGLGGDQGGPEECPETDADWENLVSNGQASILTARLDANVELDGVNLMDTFSTQASPLGGAVGFVTASQPGASWDIIDMKIPRMLVKTWTNQLVRYDPADRDEEVMQDVPQQYCGRGRLCRNSATGKTFYVCDSSFLKVFEPPPAPEEWTFTLENGAETEEIKKKVVVVG